MRLSILAALLSCAFATPSFAGTLLSYVIVTDQSLAAAFAPLAVAHTAQGLPAEVHTLQEIQALYPVAADDAERVRFHLKDLHSQRGLRFVLLGGDDPLVPTRFAYLRTVYLGDIFVPMDQYFACLAGTWNADGDSLWGEIPQVDEPGDSVSYVPDLAVGRAPVTTPAEAQAFVAKTLAALASADPLGPKRALLAGSEDVLDYAQTLEPLLPVLAARPNLHVARLYAKSASWPGSYPETRATLLDSLAAGYDLAILAGPGGSGVFQAGASPGELLTTGDFGALANAPVSFGYALSAYTTQAGPGSVARAWIGAPGGAAAVVGSSDIQFAGTAQNLMNEFFHQAIELHVPTAGEALQQAIQVFPSPLPDNVRLTSQATRLFGDPALPVPGSAEAPVSARIALVESEVSAGAARLTWFGEDVRGIATVERRGETTDWSDVGSAQPEGDGLLVFVDHPAPGRYAYRLRTGTDISAETWLTIPGSVLALAGFRPNPADGARTVAFTLPVPGPATLELFDARGRSVVRRALGTLGAGPHAIALGAGVPAGVYWIRLAQAGAVRTERGVVTR